MRYEAVVPLPTTLSAEGMESIGEKIRETAYVVGLAIELDAEDDYELALIVQGIEQEVEASGYLNGSVHIMRPTPKAAA